MARTTAPFSGYEFMIAWRYLRARRAEGGVSVMTWISVIGITLAVFALIATMAVRAGFRAEFVSTILGANAHVAVYSGGEMDADGQMLRGFGNYAPIGEALAAIPGVTHAAPVVRAQVMVSDGERNSGAEVYGIAAEDSRQFRRWSRAMTIWARSRGSTRGWRSARASRVSWG